ncbi:MAG: hypothetical protein A3D31_02540 [Candidatus Fluviicola riflensis]|nr:MAG: hypothetical protein A3D31_02540 [Candidatus Fluviicola riflensis]OGS85892.1 MAG: hypothetical protein A3E30_10025 [Fluviicola sp. RIFCSPHIGHO2_12_FULL_43_24]OGS86301.1 MAG: hypothetical protein A2724_01995 [Fluviicola sp. RIFCSPHIGHO2_01_FULL_43_53]
MSFAHAQTPPTTVSVYFDTDQHTLTPDSREKLNELIQHLDTVTGADMSISGHTDSRAGQTYNDQLSERRIASVQDYLTKNVKVSLPTIVERKAQGENNPVDNNQTAVGMAKNRRVDIEIRYPVEAVKSEIVVAQPMDSIKELYRLLCDSPVTYTIDNRFDTILSCEKGTVISIPAYCFVKQNQSNYMVTLTIRETIELSDILLGNLNTMAGNELLETGGMVEIDAADQSGTTLDLLTDKSLTLYLPTDSVQADFETFYGSRNQSAQETVNWHQDNYGHEIYGWGYVGIPWNYWANCWSEGTQYQKCKFFFCRISRLDESIKGGFNKSQRASNKQFRNEQKLARRGQKRMNSQACLAYGTIYRLTPPDTATFLALNKAYMFKNNLKTVDETLQFMRKQQDSVNAIQLETMKVIQKQQDSINALRFEVNQLSYNALTVTKLGMINCDRFAGKGQSLITLSTTTPYTPNIDAKMIFTDIKSILSANQDAQGNLSFNNIPKGKKVWVVFLKIENKQPYMSVQEIKTGKEKSITPDFKAVTTNEIKRTFRKFNH